MSDPSLNGGASAGEFRGAAAVERGSSTSPAVSVVVATRNRPVELGHCLLSLHEQGLAAERIVVVDDAPGAGETAATVLSCDTGKAPLRYVEGDGSGLAAAHNRGLLEVDTPIVAFTDDDVVVDQGWLAAIVEAFAFAPRVGCVTGMILPLELETHEQVWLDGYAGFNKGTERRLFDLAENRPDDPLFPLAAGMFGSGANMAFSTEVLNEMGGFDAALGAGTRARGGDDLAAFLEVLVRGYRLVYEPAAVVHHRHARDYGALRRQVYGYGVGLTAYLTKSMIDRPGLLAPAARRLPRAAAHVLSPRSRKNARRPRDYPRELARLERRGMLAGPVAYLRSRARQREFTRAHPGASRSAGASPRAKAAMSAQRIPVLLYHSVSDVCDPRFAEWTVTPALFADHMRYLADNGYRSVTVRELVERVFERREALDARSVVITFDDGFADFYTHAWPHLRRHSHSATVFVATGYVGRTSLWLARQGEAQRPMLTWSQIEELGQAGIECGSHGHEHPQLDAVPAARAWSELTQSREALEAVVGPVASFAYPHGYYTRTLQRQVARAGFSSACAVKDALSSTEDDRFAIARAVVRGGTSLDAFGRIVRGEGIGVAPAGHTLRRGAWRMARRAGVEPLLERLRSGRAPAPAREAS